MTDSDTDTTNPGALGGTAAFTAPWDCDKDHDHGDRKKLYELARLEPDLAHRGYVFLGGDFFHLNKEANKLLVPNIRITGIECSKIIGTTLPNYWQAAWEEARKSFGKDADILLGINSYEGRTEDQLHIHLTGLKKDIRAQLDKLDKTKLRVATWNSNIHVLHTKDGTKDDTYVYRVAHVDNLDKNPFTDLDEHVATQKDSGGKTFNDRWAQSLAVTAGANGAGYFLIATQGAAKSGQPKHVPDLETCAPPYYGGKTFEALRDPNWK